MTHPFHVTEIASESDVVTVRQRAKRIAALMGFDRQDQTRVATAVSEIARNAFSYGGGGRAAFSLEDREGRGQVFTVTITDLGRGIADLPAILEGRYTSPTGMGLGITGARRLMDRFEITSVPGSGTTVVLGKSRPRLAPRLGADELAEIGERLHRESGADPFALLREQNRELLQSFADLTARQEEMHRLNRELEDTNRGIVALYSELDQKAEQLREASELKTRFLSYVSHEFRTPLNSILGLTRILLDRLDGELTGEQERQVLYIRQSADSLNELVNDLLDLAKVEAGRIDVRPSTFSVTDLFAALRGALKPLQVNPAVDLVIGPVDGMPMLHTDEGKLAQILRNLVSNALKFTETGSVSVTAGIDRRREAIAFVVADTGIGIAPEHITKIFEEFSQVDSPLQRKQKGTGLGLPLSRKLAEILGGSLEAESRVGEGSVFRLLLPLSAAVSPVLRPAGDGRRQRLLVVDDETSFRYLVRQLLRDRPGLEIVEAVDGEDAVERLSGAVPDAILLDLHMPRRDGFDVFETIRKSERLRGIPVFVATSQPVTASIEARLTGVAGFMPKKDLARERLIALLDRVAEQRSRP